MNYYVIMQKGTTKIAVDIVSESAGEEIRALQSDGFKITIENVEARSSKEALEKANVSNVAMKSSQNLVSHESKYQIAQLVSKCISILGWLIFASGLLLALAGLGAGNGRYGFDFWLAVAGIAPGFVTLVSGLFLVATSHVMRATLDNAEHTFQILSQLKSQVN
ncbi:hypothetical protein VST7929_01092 [Vibrio stylophorae]|uniref:Uncharacterized protein n=1 Tax=Vibrio stylophorae TaxID=659351 RepID=A0ABN8DRQ8_9VIBR|nr:hypothetical protein [Vibrio stylophorae]CAH0533228.1 hypothetical protein VST7929_01092 [Vibrio stylophorae]